MVKPYQTVELKMTRKKKLGQVPPFTLFVFFHSSTQNTKVCMCPCYFTKITTFTSRHVEAAADVAAPWRPVVRAELRGARGGAHGRVEAQQPRWSTRGMPRPRSWWGLVARAEAASMAELGSACGARELGMQVALGQEEDKAVWLCGPWRRERRKKKNGKGKERKNSTPFVSKL
ncbi:hypothetical protein SETIT_1G259300v2 [Setaria italica]|uniref:Uncharacterized protein n=1 Tax=Setaria italica TaxID=4555 RepID=A0A368PQA7_SETIT|nr:hypothetical protein SETIT_1G259300v2 [Setaria italica]